MLTHVLFAFSFSHLHAHKFFFSLSLSLISINFLSCCSSRVMCCHWVFYPRPSWTASVARRPDIHQVCMAAFCPLHAPRLVVYLGDRMNSGILSSFVLHSSRLCLPHSSPLVCVTHTCIPTSTVTLCVRITRVCHVLAGCYAATRYMRTLCF